MGSTLVKLRHGHCWGPLACVHSAEGGGVNDRERSEGAV